ncbi:MAG: glycosyltransferase family 4 protein [Desulfobacterales bacterium]|nr:glycosyltransferase family 4 protein [Desulfobacterales bacterium]
MSLPARSGTLGMILKGYPRISETFISNEILLLEERGFHLRIFSMRSPREKFTHASVRRIRARVDYLPETIISRHLPALVWHNLLQAARRPACYAAALKVAWRRWRRTRKSATLKHLLQAGYLCHKLLRGSDCTHLHAHFAHSPTSVAFFSHLLSGRPFSFTAHAKDIYTSDPRQLKEKAAAARFVVTCTTYNQTYLATILNGERTPVYRVYHGIDLGLFRADDRRSAAEPPYAILTVARLTPKKGLKTVYQALQRLKSQGIAFRHTLIGDGEQRMDIERWRRELGLESETVMLGTRPHDDVCRCLRQADLFVLGCELAPNGDRDGIPNVILESMAMGVPVVATRFSAIPEVIASAHNGLLVESGRPEAMAAVMATALEDAALRRDMIANGLETVRRRFDNRVLVEELASVIERHTDLC